MGMWCDNKCIENICPCDICKMSEFDMVWEEIDHSRDISAICSCDLCIPDICSCDICVPKEQNSEVCECWECSGLSNVLEDVCQCDECTMDQHLIEGTPSERRVGEADARMPRSSGSGGVTTMASQRDKPVDTATIRSGKGGFWIEDECKEPKWVSNVVLNTENDRELSELETFYIQAHSIISSTGVYNYQQARIPVP